MGPLLQTYQATPPDKYLYLNGAGLPVRKSELELTHLSGRERLLEQPPGPLHAALAAGARPPSASVQQRTAGAKRPAAAPGTRRQRVQRQRPVVHRPNWAAKQAEPSVCGKCDACKQRCTCVLLLAWRAAGTEGFEAALADLEAADVLRGRMLNVFKSKAAQCKVGQEQCGVRLPLLVRRHASRVQQCRLYRTCAAQHLSPISPRAGHRRDGGLHRGGGCASWCSRGRCSRRGGGSSRHSSQQQPAAAGARRAGRGAVAADSLHHRPVPAPRPGRRVCGHCSGLVEVDQGGPATPSPGVRSWGNLALFSHAADALPHAGATPDLTGTHSR